MNEELASVILNTEVTQMSIEDNRIKYNKHYVINLCEFAELTKEWMYDQGLTNVSSGCAQGVSSGRKIQLCNIKKYVGWKKTIDIDFEDETEIDAIFKAAKWVMKTKETR